MLSCFSGEVNHTLSEQLEFDDEMTRRTLALEAWTVGPISSRFMIQDRGNSAIAIWIFWTLTE